MKEGENERTEEKEEEKRKQARIEEKMAREGRWEIKENGKEEMDRTKNDSVKWGKEVGERERRAEKSRGEKVRVKGERRSRKDRQGHEGC